MSAGVVPDGRIPPGSPGAGISPWEDWCDGSGPRHWHPRSLQADTAEPSPAGDKVRIQHLGHGIPESQIGGAHDAGGNPYRAVLTGGAHRAIPLTNSISPGRMASGPSDLNIDAHSMNTVDTTL